MYYHPKSKSFENRIVKIDQQLSFLYVLQQGTQKEPSAVRLYGIEEARHSSAACHFESFVDNRAGYFAHGAFGKLHACEDSKTMLP